MSAEALQLAQYDAAWSLLKPPTMSIYLTFQDHGNFYICQRGFPHYLGQIVRGATTRAEAEAVRDHVQSSLATCQITGYYIWVVFAGALGGNRVMLDPLWKEKINAQMRAMADFYLLDRIKPAPEKWRKFLIQP